MSIKDELYEAAGAFKHPRQSLHHRAAEKIHEYELLINYLISFGRIPESWIDTWPNKFPEDAKTYLPKGDTPIAGAR
jgi:hypothetical protein